MDNTKISTGRPLRVDRLCNEEQSGRLVKNKRYFKTIFQIGTQCKVMLENVITILDKTNGEK